LTTETLKEQWIELPSWQKILLILIFAALIMYGIFFLSIQPKYTEISKIEKEVSSLDKEVTFLKKIATPENIKTLNQELAKVKEKNKQLRIKLQELKKIIPEKSKINKILSFISTSAFFNNLTLNQFKVNKTRKVVAYYDSKNDKIVIKEDKKQKTVVKKSKKGKKKKKVNQPKGVKLNQIQMYADLTGDIPGLVKFLADISKSKRYISIDSISISKGKTDLNIKLNLSTFYSREGKI
jgi:hypothetical protein